MLVIMNERIFIVIGSDFAAFAERQLEVWSQIEGSAVEHVQFGEGQIEKVTQRKDYIPLISVRFPSRDGSVTFNSDQQFPLIALRLYPRSHWNDL